MSQNALREIVLVTREDTVDCFKDTIQIIRNLGIELSLQIKPCFLDSTQARISSLNTPQAWPSSLDLEQQEGILYLTDLPEVAMKMITMKLPVLGCLTEENQSSFFEGVRYLYCQKDGLDPLYPERVYRRYSNLPWDILTTNRCLVRETTEADLEAFYKIYEHPSITQYMEPLFSDREAERQYITSYRKNVYEFYEFGIWTVLSKESEVIGRAGLTMREEFEEPELGFVIGHPWQGEGYGYEVCKAILRYGLSELGFSKIQAFSHPQNHASLALLNKLGFRCVGVYSIDGVEHERWKIVLSPNYL